MTLGFRQLGLGLLLAVGIASCRGRAEPTKPASDETRVAEQLELVSKSLVELDVDAARRVLDTVSIRHVEVDRLRARLAIAIGDCEGAAALLSASEGAEGATARSPFDPAGELSAVAEGCARAMAGARVVVDEKRGVWVRFQNPRDEALMPLIAEVADRAATTIGKHMRTQLPRPIRIELVSDLLSLAKLTGLPLEAAETTGTIAIARWGKVTLVSPRATPEGYPWQDTLAHELTHLLVTRQSSDSAPLWLQEGVAKREETRWRERMPFDGVPDPHRQAQRALLEGRSVGIDRLGASMALLPTPEAAETAYAEVSDFLEFWLAHNGDAALVLLLRDMAGQPSDGAERAMVSVSGYGFQQWIRRWQHALLNESNAPREGQPREDALQARGPASDSGPRGDVDVARRLRLAELLLERGRFAAAEVQLKPLDAVRPMMPELARAQAETKLALGDLAGARDFVAADQVLHLDGAWLSVRGQVLRAKNELPAAEEAFRQSLAFAPTLERVACRGSSRGQEENIAEPTTKLPGEPWISLCRAALSP